ncbi:MAG: hypothetical protein K2M36_03185 [Clostridia bacterium]|nr:hypothetical protein [Clostridia bacterium]
MTFVKKSVIAALFAAIAIVSAPLMIYDLDREHAERKYCEASVYDMLSDELIDMYETEIAGEKIVSDKSASQLNRIASRLSIPVEKLKAIMLLQDLAGKAGESVSLSDLAAMSDIKLFTAFKGYADTYLSTQPAERRAELEQKLKKSLGIG